jgi:hypothetical protein
MLVALSAQGLSVRRGPMAWSGIEGLLPGHELWEPRYSPMRNGQGGSNITGGARHRPAVSRRLDTDVIHVVGAAITAMDTSNLELRYFLPFRKV